MDTWPAFVAAVLLRHGVADVDLASAYDVPAHRFYRRTAAEGWEAPGPRVRLHPSSRRSVQRALVAVASSTIHPAGASVETAAWLHGLRVRPPGRNHLTCSYAARIPRATQQQVLVRRARWLEPDDVVEVDHVPTLAVPAMFLSAAQMPPDRLWARLIDAVHRGLTTPDAVLDRLWRVGPVPGKGALRRHCERLAALRIESAFQDEVAAELGRLGYRPERSTRRIDTADGIGLEVDVPLPLWQVAVEPDGDAFHRTREQRRRDRRRDAAYAGTDWVRVPIDWRDWLLDREHVLRAVDAAIAAQRRRGVGAHETAPTRPGVPSF